MANKEKRPPVKESVGALRYCFDIDDENGQYTGTYDTDIIVTKVAKSVKMTENGDNVSVYASGEEYDSVSSVSSIDNEVEAVAFPADDLAKMRGDEVTDTGLIIRGGSRNRPFFAFGKTVKLRNGKERWLWYPKCKLLSNTDDTNTKEESFSEQNDTITIRAYPFDADGQKIVVEFDTSVKTVEGLTEDKFFDQVLTGDDDFKKITTQSLKGSKPVNAGA